MDRLLEGRFGRAKVDPDQGREAQHRLRPCQVGGEHHRLIGSLQSLPPIAEREPEFGEPGPGERVLGGDFDRLREGVARALQVEGGLPGVREGDPRGRRLRVESDRLPSRFEGVGGSVLSHVNDREKGVRGGVHRRLSDQAVEDLSSARPAADAHQKCRPPECRGRVALGIGQLVQSSQCRRGPTLRKSRLNLAQQRRGFVPSRARRRQHRQDRLVVERPLHRLARAHDDPNLWRPAGRRLR